MKYFVYFATGLFLGLTLVACASFPYKHFVLHYRQGILSGPDPKGKQDLPISVCDDTIQSKANCYVMLRADFIQLEKDMDAQKRELDACQKGHQ